MAEAEKAKRTIATHCDSRCQYADPEAASSCDCECGGANHGKGEDQRVWKAKEDRHEITRRAFRQVLNTKEARSGNRLYRRNRAEFDKQYAEYKLKITGEQPVEFAPTPETLKENPFKGHMYQHIRYANKKTAYTRDGKVITKAEVPTELGW